MKQWDLILVTAVAIEGTRQELIPRIAFVSPAPDAAQSTGTFWQSLCKLGYSENFARADEVIE